MAYCLTLSSASLYTLTFPWRIMAMMTPYMATASQKITLCYYYQYLTKFLDLMRGALTAAPRILAPDIKMPLSKIVGTKLLQQRKHRELVRFQHKPRNRGRYRRRVDPSLCIKWRLPLLIGKCYLISTMLIISGKSVLLVLKIGEIKIFKALTYWIQ